MKKSVEFSPILFVCFVRFAVVLDGGSLNIGKEQSMLSQAPSKPAHPGEELVNAMMANLTANNRDPAAIGAKLDGNQVAAAVPQQQPAAPATK